MKIDLADYFAQHRVGNELQLTPAIEHEAARTVELVNHLLEMAAASGIVLPRSPITGTHCSSGWRPPSVNASTPGAAVNSNHMTGRSLDVYDPDGDLDNWLMTEKGQAALEAIGLWIEHPACTKSWSHLQTIPPGSGRRVYYP